jgi:hypothetical protein
MKTVVYCPYCRSVKEATAATPFVAKVKCACGKMLDRELVFVALEKLKKSA